jgi:hypothetical protein
MRIVEDRRSDVAREVSLLRKLGANRRFKSMQLFRRRQNWQRSVPEGSADDVRTLEKTAA